MLTALETPLIIAATYNHPSLIKLLLAHGANINLSKNAGTALSHACDFNKRDAAQCLIEAGADFTSSFGPTERHLYVPIMIAATKGHLEILALLRAHNAPFVGSTSVSQSTALHAAINGHSPVETTKWLLQNGFDVNLTDMNRATAVHAAIEAKNNEVLAQLIAAGADLTSQRRDGFVPLQLAAQQNDVQAFKMMWQAGADPHIDTGYGSYTPLVLAIMHNAVQIVQLLVADKDFLAAGRARNSEMNYLGIIVCAEHTECLAVLLKSRAWQGMPTNVRNAIEGKWLCLATGTDGPTIDTLAKHATDLKQMVAYRWPGENSTALHIAVKSKMTVQIVCRLLKMGIDVSARDKDNQTAADLARTANNTMLATLLDRAAEKQQANTEA